MKSKTCKSPLDDVEEIGRIDKSNMVSFSVQAPKHYHKAAEISEKIVVNYQKPDNVIVAGMGGSAIGGELLKDYARSQAPVPIEVSKDYTLPAYADSKTLVLVVSYSGDTEESLSAFLDATKRQCMVYC